jgi:hypothetical protein
MAKPKSSPVVDSKHLAESRNAKVYDVPFALIRASAPNIAQRELNRSRAQAIAADLDFNKVGTPVVNRVNGHYNPIDGQHRLEAMKIVFGEDASWPCLVYEGLTEKEEADLFLGLNDSVKVAAFPKFMIAVTAERVLECAILRIVEANGVKVSRDKRANSCAAIKALYTVYEYGEMALALTMRTLRKAFPEDPTAFEHMLVLGLGLVYARFPQLIDERRMSDRLSVTPLGVRGVIQRAEHAWQKTGQPRKDCFASAFIDIYNRNYRRDRVAPLPSWWKHAATADSES